MFLRNIRLRQEFLNLQLLTEDELFLLRVSSFTTHPKLRKVDSSELSFFQVQVAGSTLHRVVELLALLGFSSIWKVFIVSNLKFFSLLSLNLKKFMISSHLESQNSVGLDNYISFLESLHVTTDSPRFLLFRTLFSCVVLADTIAEFLETVENLVANGHFSGTNSLLILLFFKVDVLIKESSRFQKCPIEIIYTNESDGTEDSCDEVQKVGEELDAAINLELMKKVKKVDALKESILDLHVPRSKKLLNRKS
ncbi:hypothetical protein GEMRC1_003262 [Eukaryota sp. GEM-RC1]